MSIVTAKTATLCSFALAGALNLLEATADPDGTAWTAARAIASVAFAACLLLWLVATLSAKRRLE